jgi:hypothetical protein
MFIANYIVSKDQIVPKASTLLHFNNDKPQKSLFGGTLSIIIESYIIFVILSQGRALLWNENPYISTVKNSYADSLTKIHLNETSKIIMAVQNFT